MPHFGQKFSDNTQRYIMLESTQDRLFRRPIYPIGFEQESLLPSFGQLRLDTPPGNTTARATAATRSGTCRAGYWDQLLR